MNEEEEEDAHAHTHRSPNVDEVKEEWKGIRVNTCIRHGVDTKMVKRTPLVFLLKANTYVLWGMAMTTSRTWKL